MKSGASEFMLPTMLLLQQSERIGPAYLGILIPAVTFLIALLAAWLLYKRFTK